jgi:three-Cys-motif partner protein
LNWDVIAKAGQMKSIDMFLNFPMMDMNRNAFWRQPAKVGAGRIERMNAFWGDESWRESGYEERETLCGPELFKQRSPAIVEAYRRRLKEVAGFEHVSRPLPMRNDQEALISYLLLASKERVAEEIVDDIFQKYETRGIS